MNILNMNILDIITAGIIIICVVICYAKGLLISIFNLLSLFISFTLTRQLYPYVSDFLRKTPLFYSLKQLIGGWIGQNASVPDTGQIVSETIQSMTLPDVFKNLVMQNIDAMPGLDLTSVYDYVSEYAAGLAIDAIAIAAVFIAVFFLMRIIALVLRIVSKIPVIKTFNHIGGGVMGFVIGALLSWLVLSVMRGLFAANPDFPVADLLEKSIIAKYFMMNI